MAAKKEVAFLAKDAPAIPLAGIRTHQSPQKPR
jgi:hypothetical protein